MARYLLTGGTGLLGRQLVPLLLRRGAQVHALVRPGSLQGRAALLEAWRELADRGDGRLVVHAGDVTLEGLGATDLPAEPFDHVLHLAARYDLHAAEADLRLTNVAGTANLLALLAERGFGGVLHHVSSIAVAGDHAGPLSEDDFDLGQGWPHPYHASKHASEGLVRDAIEAGVLRARIYRPSAIVGDSVSGRTDRADGPYILFGAVKRARDAFPRWFPLYSSLSTPINIVPVDWVAAALDHLAHQPGLDGRTFHLVDPSPPPFRATFSLLADAAGAPRLRRLPGGGLRKLAPGAFAVAGQLQLLRELRDWTLGDLGVDLRVADAHNRDITYTADATTDTLRSTGGPSCPPQPSYLPALWDFWLRNLDPATDPAARVRARFGGRVVLITGSSSGVGAELAVRCAAAGAHVVLVARREEELRTVATRCEEAGGSASVHPADLSDPQQCDALIEAVLAERGRVDVLVNNAARSIRRPLAESLRRGHDFERVMRLNYLAPVRLIGGFLPGMRERGEGAVVNVLTAGVALPSPFFGAYGASKAALSHLTDTAAAEFLSDGVHFCSVYLPWVRTPMMDTTGLYEETPAMSPAQAADWIVDGVVDRRTKVMDGTTRRRWMLNAAAPRFLVRALSLVYRIYADDESDHPEFELDRAVLRRFVKGKPV